MSEPKDLNILVVDDEPSIVELLSEYLQARGHKVWTAQDGEQALILLENQDLDLVLTDMKMPGLGGLDLLERIHNRERFIGTILMTGYGTIDTALRAMKTGALDYLLKPFKLREVHAAIIRAAERTRLERETVRLREVVRLFEAAHSMDSAASLDNLYEQTVTVVSSELDGKGALIAFLEPVSRRWMEYGRTPKAPLSGLDLQTLGLAICGEANVVDSWMEYPQHLLAVPIPVQTDVGIPPQRVGLLAVVGGRIPEQGRISLEIAASLLGDTLTRQILGDPSRERGLRWGNPLSNKEDRGRRLLEGMRRVEDLLPPADRAMARQAALAYGALSGTTRALLKAPLPTPSDLHPAEERALREILLGVTERHEGGGCPRGVGGGAIPLASRLLALVDYWDWLTCSRAYAPLIERNRARQILSARGGALFDPTLTGRFLSAIT